MLDANHAKAIVLDPKIPYPEKRATLAYVHMRMLILFEFLFQCFSNSMFRDEVVGDGFCGGSNRVAFSGVAGLRTMNRFWHFP